MSYQPLQERLTSQLIEQGHSSDSASNLAKKLLLQRGHIDSSGNLTPEGQKRSAMGPEQRAIDRMVKKYNGKYDYSDFEYDYETNRATLSKR